MDWVLTGAVVFAAWTVASLLGHERQRRIAAATPAPPAADTPADTPGPSGTAH